MSTTSSLEGNYSPTSPLELQYGDATSSIYPNRPIRPLPRRRLRSRLSPEVVESILNPQGDAISTTLTQSKAKDGKTNPGGSEDLVAGSLPQQSAGQQEDSYQFRGSETLLDATKGPHQRSASIGLPPIRNGYLVTRHDDSRSYRQAHMPPPIPSSTASSGESVDGYDSFENTNNKKKRKIPISGSLGSHQSSLATDMAQMDISSTRDIDVSQIDPDVGVGQYYGSGSSAVAAFSHALGAASTRGRFGRSGLRRHSGRSPLGVSFNGTNATQTGRSLSNSKAGSGAGTIGKPDAVPAKASDQGIISAAIANAAALPTTPARGQENVSLLDSQSKKPSSSKTQFTFTCESDSAKSMTWPGYGYPSPKDSRDETPTVRAGNHTSSKSSKGFSTQGTQTSPSMADQTNQPSQPSAHQQAAQQPRKPRRTLAKQLALAARDRKMAQDYENYNNPPKRDKVWVCDFCEYEMIFGEPPSALIRDYERKDRSERRRLAEKRRLLEKAKMKSRKGKKGTKNNKNQNATQPQQQSQRMRRDSQTQEQMAGQSQDTQSDEQILDDYDEDPYDPLPSEPIQQTPSKIPQPVAQNPTHSLRPPAGNSIRRGGSAIRAA